MTLEREVTRCVWICFVFFIYVYNKRNTTTVCWSGEFVTHLVACVMPYHARPPVSRDTALHKQLDVIQPSG